MRLAVAALLAGTTVVAACGSGAGSAGPAAQPAADASASAPASDATAGTSPETELDDLAQAKVDAWLVNSTGDKTAVIGDSEVNVQAVDVVVVDGSRYLRVTATGMPDYEHAVTDSDLTFLTSRPLAARDFVDGQPTVAVGDVVEFGEDIGYVSTGCQDADGTGYGYWPPGPACPTAQDYTDVLIPLDPVPATTEVETSLGSIGLWVNGVAIFNWGDGQSWDNAGVWQNLAPVAERYDLDLCPGHSAGGQYHHHSHPTCLADELGDDGSQHSPIYGFAADGYPVYGPWVADGVLARSSWVARDYDDPTSLTGCGQPGVRTCQLVDVTDPSAGTVDVAAGPTTGDTASTLSGNTFATVSGTYMQDYWFDASLNDGSLQALDEHNGHDHDGLGYHYHVTRERADDGSLADAFPYYVGPTYAGALGGSTVTQTGGAGGAPAGGPPGGPPPNGMPPPNGPRPGSPPPND